MAIEHPEVDVVTMGAGFTAAITAQQLTAEGFSVVSLEKGGAKWSWPDFAHNHDELRFVARHELMHGIEKESWTWRPDPQSPSLPTDCNWLTHQPARVILEQYWRNPGELMS